jgi:hypothetical protein
VTCIVYRDGVLAADTRVLDCWTSAGNSIKIAKRGPLLAGATGESSITRVFLDWFRSEAFLEWLKIGGGPYCDMMIPGRDKETTGFVVLPDDSLLRFENGNPPYRVRSPFYAFGSGSWVALGALDRGATAVEAVEVAGRWDIGTGPVGMVLRRNS